MPTVLRFGGFRVVIYPNDHSPAHVHVVGAQGEAVFDLGEFVSLRESWGLRASQINAIATVLNEQSGALIDAWERIHGHQ